MIEYFILHMMLWQIVLHSCFYPVLIYFLLCYFFICNRVILSISLIYTLCFQKLSVDLEYEAQL